MNAATLTVILLKLTFCYCEMQLTCSQTTVIGKGTSTINDKFASKLALDFGYNRTLFNRNTKLLYSADSLMGSEIAVSTNASNPISFAANIVPLLKEDYMVDGFQHLQTFPLMATTIVIIYNLPDISKLTLSLEILSLIYQGLITSWNHFTIQAINPGIVLPSAKIVVVARRDDSGTTYSITSALSEVDDKWNEKYGKFSDPNFIDRRCCNSTKWPEGAITYYAAGGVGLVGILTSIPYTIGYTTLGNANDNSMPFAALMNYANQSVMPTPDSVRSAITYFSMFNDQSFDYNLHNAKIPNAYPLVTYVYFLVHMTTHPDITCCAMQETVAFFDWLLYDVNASILYSYGFVPLPDTIANQIKRSIFRVITCRGNSVYDAYMESKKPTFDTLQLWQIILIIISVLFVVVFVGTISIVLNLQRKRKAEQTKWFIPMGKITPNIIFETVASRLSGTTTSTSQSSYSSTCDFSESSKNNAAFQLQHVLEIGDFDGDPVYLQPLINFSYPLTWKRATKKLMLKFTQDLVHRNVNRILGVAFWQGSLHLVLDFSFKGTLHYVLQTCRYDLNDTVKFSLALDVTSGMQYLTTKGIIHGYLSSISCYVDGTWTVKISEWSMQSLCIAESVIKPEYLHDADSQSNYSAFIRLLYKDFDMVQRNKVKHDVFSFGMLLLEIFSRKLPYHHDVEECTLTYSQILDDKFLNNRYIEPGFSFFNIPAKVAELINQCCQANSLRITFHEIALVLNKLKPSKKGIIDTMMDIVESHAIDLHKKTSDLQNLNTRMEELLYEVLPPQIANKLFHGEIIPPEHFESVTICFIDVVGFTNISAKSSPHEVMAFLHDLWLLFDNILHKHDAYKIDTIGDAYLVCSGLPQRNGNEHCKHIANLSLSLIDECETFKIFHLPNEKLAIRVGINSGSVTAGIVGSKMPQYCIFGDAVNVAARMQSTSFPMKIQVSEIAYDLLQSNYINYVMERRGQIDVKGKGLMTTYWLLNKRCE